MLYLILGALIGVFAQMGWSAKSPPCRITPFDSSARAMNYPYLVIIDMINDESPEYNSKGAGAIISPHWVLSTPPCSHINADYKCDTSNYEFVIRIPDPKGNPGAEYEADLHMHESYSWIDYTETFLPSNDIALYKVKRPINFGPRALPIKLLDAYTKLDPEDVVQVIGLGSARNNFHTWNIHARARTFNVTIVPRSTCEKEARLALRRENAIRRAEETNTPITPELVANSLDAPVQRFEGHVCVADLDPDHQLFCEEYESSIVVVNGSLAGLFSVSRKLFQIGGNPVYTYVDVNHYRNWILSHTGLRAVDRKYLDTWLGNDEATRRSNIAKWVKDWKRRM